MTKQQLDIMGGSGSLITAVICAALAAVHDPHDRMFIVWIVTAVVLLFNAVAMFIHAASIKATEDKAE